jgi:hypothetical protein
MSLKKTLKKRTLKKRTSMNRSMNNKPLKLKDILVSENIIFYRSNKYDNMGDNFKKIKKYQLVEWLDSCSKYE